VDVVFRLAAAAVLISSVKFSGSAAAHPLLATGGLVLLAGTYLVLSYLPGCSRPGEATKLREQQLIRHCDALVLGLCVLLLPFSYTTLVSAALLVAVRAVCLGGIGLLAAHVAIFTLGMLVAFAARRPDIVLHTSETVSIVAILALPCFLVYLGSRMYRRQLELDTGLQSARLELVQLKLNNYKLAKYLSPSLRKAILSGKRVALETQRKRVTVFFSDIVGFSELSEQLETDVLTEMLNLYLSEMSDIALKFGGTIDKFIGDAIMVFFGDPVTKGAKEDCVACVAMALTMQKRMIDLNKRWSAQGIKQPLAIRIGINTGFCTVGNFGTESRFDYTLLGTEVNKASRLESQAQAGQILISRGTYELVKDLIYCEPRGALTLKGFSEPVEAFAAVDLRANLGKEEFCVEHTTEGFTMFMDLENIPHLQKQRVMANLEEAYEQLRRDIFSNTRAGVKIIK